MNAFLKANFRDKLYLNSCPRTDCNGAVRLTRDMWGYFLHCLTCGWHCDYYGDKSLLEIIAEDKEQRLLYIRNKGRRGSKRSLSSISYEEALENLQKKYNK